ncbi:MAG: hypothetical protein JNK65_03250 [Deltaproteobacteria bacterium]|nr:hypothetical protein [Deltaproteobacteria bacterium]
MSELSNKYLRGKVLEEVPNIIRQLEERGDRLEGKSGLEVLVSVLWMGGDRVGANSPTGIPSGHNTPLQKYIEIIPESTELHHRLEQALLQAIEYPREGLIEFIKRHEKVIELSSPEEITELFEGMHKIHQGSKEGLEMFWAEEYPSVEKMNAMLKELEVSAFEQGMGVAFTKSDQATMKKILEAQEPITGFLELSQRFQESKDSESRQQLQEIFKHLLRGDLETWRDQGAEGSIDY